MRLHCNTFGHYKDTLICAMSCPYTHRCHQFRDWLQTDDHQAQLWQRILKYIRAHPNNPYELILTPKHDKPTKENAMKQYACIHKEQVLILTEEEITAKLLQGVTFDQIIELGREMEIQIRLVPASKANSRAATTSQKTKDDDDPEEPDLDETNGQSRHRPKKKTASHIEIS